MEYFGPDKELPEYPEDEVLKVPEPVLTTKWAHGGTTVHKEAKNVPTTQKNQRRTEMPTIRPAEKVSQQIEAMPRIVAYSPIADDEYDSPYGSEPTNKRVVKNQQLIVTLIIVGVVLVCVIGLTMLVSQPSLADKQCTDKFGPGGVWVPAMSQCGCGTGYTMYDDDSCQPN